MASGKTDELAFQRVQLAITCAATSAGSSRSLTKANTTITYPGESGHTWSENEFQDDYYMVMSRYNSGSNVLALSMVNPNATGTNLMGVKNIFNSGASSATSAHIHGILIPKSLVEEG